MIIKNLTSSVDYNYPEKKGKENLFINGGGSYGSYALDVRTNNFTYGVDLVNIIHEVSPLTISLLYNDIDLNSRGNKISNSFRLNVAAFIIKDINNDIITLYDFDGTINKFTRGNEGYYNISKRNGEILTISNNTFIIEDLNGNKKHFNQSGYIKKYEIKCNEKTIIYKFKYDGNFNINSVLIDDVSMVTITKSDSNIKVTYKSKTATINLSNDNKVTSVELANGMIINYTYEGNRLKKIETKEDPDVKGSDKLDILNVHSRVEKINEYRVSGYIQRTIIVQKHGTNYLVYEKEGDLSFEVGKVYSFDDNTGKVKYVYDNQYSNNVFNSNIQCFFDDRITSTFFRDNICFIGKNYTLTDKADKKILIFEESTNFKKYHAYFIKYDIENSSKAVTIQAKYNGSYIQKEVLEIGRTQGIFDIIILPVDQNIENLSFEISPSTGTKINTFQIYGIEKFVIPAVHTNGTWMLKHFYSLSDYDHYFLYFGKYKRIRNQESYYLTKEEFMQNHLNFLKSSGETFRYFYDNFSNSKMMSVHTKVFHFIDENVTSDKEFEFGQGFAQITVKKNNLATIQDLSGLDDNGLIKVIKIAGRKKFNKRTTQYFNKNDLFVKEENDVTVPKVFTHNSYGQVLTEKMQNNSGKYMLKENQYDASCNLTSQTSLNQKVKYSYDEYNRCTSDNEFAYKKINYDIIDNINSISRGNYSVLLKNTNSFTYDQESNLTKVNLQKQNYVNPNVTDIDRTITYEYDEYGNVKTIKQGDYILASFTYSTSREIIVTIPDKGVKCYKYDEFGRLVQISEGPNLNSLSVVLVNIYNNYYIIDDDITDPFDARLTRDSTSVLAATISKGVRTTYDKDENETTANGPCSLSEGDSYIVIDGIEYTNQSSSDEPNVQKNKVNNTNVDKHSLYISNTLDDFGRLSSKELQYKIENLKTSTDLGSIKSEYTYCESNNRVSNMLKKLLVKKGDTVLFGEEYTFNNLGKVKSIKDTLSSKTKTFTYDSFNRLSTVKRDDKTYAYTYDKFGNILTRKVNNADDKTMNYDSLDRITKYNDWDYTYHEGSNGFDYVTNGMYTKSRLFANGRLQGEIYNSDDGEEIYTYYDVSYTYDGEGRLKERTCSYNNGTFITTKYTYYKDRLVSVGEGENKLSIYYEGNVATAFLFDNQLYRYIRNALGEIIHIVDKDGNIIVTYTYDEWGKVLSVKDTSLKGIGKRNPLKYKGYLYDEETKLYYLISRFYDPEVGRFISSDDVGYIDIKGVDGLNLYCYCGNDPINYADPSGHFAISTLITLGLIAFGAIVGGTVAGVNSYNNGNTGWELLGDILGGALIGGIIGGTIGYFAAPSIAAMISSTGTIGGTFAFAGGFGSTGGAIAISTLGEIALAGTAILTGLGSFGATCMFAKTSKQSGKATSSDKPSWVNESMVDRNITAQQNTKNILDGHYGPGNWPKGPKTEYNKIIKWIERHLKYYKGW